MCVCTCTCVRESGRDAAIVTADGNVTAEAPVDFPRPLRNDDDDDDLFNPPERLFINSRMLSSS